MKRRQRQKRNRVQDYNLIIQIKRKCLEALAVNNGGTRLVILLLGDPHLLEGGERGQDGTTNPDRVLALRGSNDLDLHGRRSKSSQLLLHTVSNTGEHGGSTRQHNVAVQVLTDIDITLHDGVVRGLVDTSSLHTQERGLEESLRAPEALVTDGDNLTIRQLVGLLESGGRGSSLHLLLEVKSDVGELLLDVTDNLTLGSGGERVTTLGQDLHHVVGQITTSQIQTEDGVRKGITFIDGDGVGNTISRIHDDTSGTTRGVQGQDGLDSNVHGGGVEGLEHDLSHLLTVGLGVKRSLSQKDRVLLRGNTELVVEGVMPDLLHIVPVGDNTVLNGVLQGEDTTLGLGLISNKGVLGVHTDHNTGVTGTTDDGGEDGTRSVITSETGLAHTGSIVDHKGLNFVVTHID